MSVRPFRFVHATNLRLDQPLWGVGSVTPASRQVAEDATLTAWANVVSACLEHRVQCLLLTGNCFDAAHVGRARMMLEDACERLAAQDVEVFIVPGETDPSAAWAKGTALPKNVTVFVSRHSEPVAVVRDSEVLATVEPYEDRQRPVERAGPSTALKIGMVGAGQHRMLQTALAATGEGDREWRSFKEFPQSARFGYLALGNGDARFTVELPHGIAHDPGCPQPLDGRRTTSGGCSLVEVDRGGRLHVVQVPTAVVRREEIDVSLVPGATWDELARQMQTALLEREPLPTETLWLVRWIIGCEGSLAGALAEASSRQDLCELVEQELADDRGVIRQHEMEVRSDWPRDGESDWTGSVGEEFTTLIDEHLPERVDRFRRRLPALDWPEAGWVRHIMDAGERITPQAVAVHARVLARQSLIPLDHTRRDA
ncbi:MAG: exonuclease SbcCD subunit D [Planctomycetaceae bacterium]